LAESHARDLVRELEQYKSEFDDHGFSLKHRDGLIEIKRGPLDIVRIVFNYGDSGRHRVSNGVADALRQGLDVDFDEAHVAVYEFKNQLRHATDLFYANKARLQALGLA
jgi:hypothetical protein